MADLVASMNLRVAFDSSKTVDEFIFAFRTVSHGEYGWIPDMMLEIIFEAFYRDGDFRE